MKQNVNRTKQANFNIQIRSGTYSHQFSNRPNLLERDAYAMAKVYKKTEIQRRYALKHTLNIRV